MMQDDPKKPADAHEPPAPAEPDPLGIDVDTDSEPAEQIEEKGEPFDSNFA